MEFQAVIMAAGRGSRMTDLTAKTPKALLPIGNQPLLWYPIQLLERAGFGAAIVIVLDSYKETIEKTLNNFCDVKMKLDFVGIPDDEDWGTADSLRYIGDKLKSDILVLSCDLLTGLSLHLLADIHRTHDATVTMLLASNPEHTTDMAAPGTKSKKKLERDLIGLDEKESRVVFMSSEADFEEFVPIRKSLLKRQPCVNIHTNLMDGHLYLMKKSVIDLLRREKNISGIRGELLPYLVKKQFTQSKDIQTEDSAIANDSVLSPHNSNDIHRLAEEDDMVKMAREMSTSHQGPLSDSNQDNQIRCYAYLMPAGCFCLRANTLPSYCEANRQIPRQISSLVPGKEVVLVHQTASIAHKSQVGSDSMIAEGVSIAEKVTVKKSVIGSHCIIGEKVKITNSVIMDHVKIMEGSVINGCVICEKAQVNEKCELKDCLIGSSQSIVAMGKFTNEVIVDIERMMEI